uniref:Uncharacterized protein n=1 Tax=Myotis myotis TaxID=51298 RepID=A0A7J7Z6U4_MYOMY|nr:hypothetical protein mMyoMyo1_010758 [Myotis myotis]
MELPKLPGSRHPRQPGEPSDLASDLCSQPWTALLALHTEEFHSSQSPERELGPAATTPPPASSPASSAWAGIPGRKRPESRGFVTGSRTFLPVSCPCPMPSSLGGLLLSSHSAAAAPSASDYGLAGHCY